MNPFPILTFLLLILVAAVQEWIAKLFNPQHWPDADEALGFLLAAACILTTLYLITGSNP